MHRPAPLVLLLAAGFAPTAHAATLEVPAQHPTIQAAVDAAVAGDTIHLAAGTFVEDVVVLSKDLTFTGEGMGVTVWQAGGTKALAVAFGNATGLHDLTIDGGGSGAGVEIGGGTVEVTGVEFLDTSTPGGGGALELSGVTGVIVTDSRFIGSTAVTNGGAIEITNSAVATATIVRNVFCGTTAFGAAAVSADGLPGTFVNNLIVDADGASAVSLDGAWEVAHNLILTATGAALDHGGSGTLAWHHNVVHDVNERLDAPGVVDQHDNAYGSAVFIGNGSDASDLTGTDPTLWLRGDPGSACALDDALPIFDSPLVDRGPTADDLDGSLTDIGLSGGPEAPADWFRDDDGDDAAFVSDCDDADAGNAPHLPETCAVPGDNDCDGLADDDDPDTYDLTTWGRDDDHDGYGQAAYGGYVIACDNPDPAFFVDNSLDCDDTNPYIHPDADEVCSDGIDNDCDALVDDPSAIDARAWYVDADGDGWGAYGTYVLDCLSPYDSDEGIPYTDLYGDCNDLDPFVNPDAEEVCDGIDNDCYAGEFYATDATTWVPDLDGDGYASEVESAFYVHCEAPDDYIDLQASLGPDCDDTNAGVHPGAAEVCDTLDNDCNGAFDDVGGPTLTLYDDLDGDGFGVDGTERDTQCPQPGQVEKAGDCDDDDASRHPDAPEICDGIDNDCSGTADDGPATAWFRDVDGDGFGDPDPAQRLDQQCQPVGWVADDGDCMDAVAEVNPTAEEIPGNDVDEDCDGTAQGAPGGSDDGVDARSGCQCTTGPVSPMTGLWLLGLAGLLRRRRR